MNATIGGLLDSARTQLPAPWEGELLLARLLGVERTALYCHPEQLVCGHDADRFNQQVEKRRCGWPVAYLLGQREFWSLPLQVTPDTLIPRPETESLVEKALHLLPQQRNNVVVDLGTGCGAIALAIASERPEAEIIATDNNLAALKIADLNKRRLGLERLQLLHGDLFAPLAGICANLIVSNPPYLHQHDPHLGRGDLRFEPRHALSAGADALAMLRRIIVGAGQYLGQGGWLAVEHGFDQGGKVRQLFQCNQYLQVQTDTDLAGHERVTAGQICN